MNTPEGDGVEVIAHRAGNGADLLAAVPPGVHTAELDLHRHRGRLVVRHAKRLPLTGRLWERWYLLPAGTPVPELAEVLGAWPPGLGLWVDAKGWSPRLVGQLLDDPAFRAAAATRPVTVSTKSWWMLAGLRPGAGADGGAVRRLRSAGNRTELALARWLPSGVALDGLVVHRRLLTSAGVVAGLRRRFGLVFTWSVPDAATAQRLAAWGVDGLIVDDPAVAVPPPVEGHHPGGDPQGGAEGGQ